MEIDRHNPLCPLYDGISLHLLIFFIYGFNFLATALLLFPGLNWVLATMKMDITKVSSKVMKWQVHKGMYKVKPNCISLSHKSGLSTSSLLQKLRCNGTAQKGQLKSLDHILVYKFKSPTMNLVD